MTGVVYSVRICETSSPPTIVMPSGRRSSETGAGRQHQRQRAEHGRHGRHQDRAEPLHARRVDGILCRQPAMALRLQREIDEDDAVLLDDADQHDDADERDDRQLGARREQGQQRAKSRRRQRRDDRQRMDQALIEHAQHDIDRDQRRRGSAVAGCLPPAGMPSRRRRNRHGSIPADAFPLPPCAQARTPRPWRRRAARHR